MPGTFTYGLYPWTWDAAELCHKPPVGAVSVLDLRRLGQQGFAGPTDDESLFAWPDGVSVPNDLVSLGSGYIATLQPSTAARNELRLKLGLAKNPAGATLVDCIADVLGALSDPTGATGPKPLMPAADGTLEIQLAGHSRVWSQTIDPANLMSANPNSRHNRIRDVIRAGIDTADDVGGLELARKVLGSWLLTMGVSREELKLGAPGKMLQWQRLLSTKVKLKHAAKLTPKEPKTSFAETWPNDCADIEATAQDQSWATLNADGFYDTLKVVSGTVRSSSAGGAQEKLGICSAAVSSEDHIVTGAFTIGDEANASVYVTARNAASAGTFYCHGVARPNQYRRTYKAVAGTLTELYGGSSEPVEASGKTFGVRCSGSTITGSATGLAERDVTDTAITGNLQGGVRIALDAYIDTYGYVGAWSIDDELPSAPVAAFSGMPLSGTSPLSVVFTDSSTNTPTSWLWEKSSDGGSSWANFTSGPTTQNPTDSFTAGTWAVRLTATNAGGSDSETKLAYITVTAAGGHKNLLTMGVG